MAVVWAGSVCTDRYWPFLFLHIHSLSLSSSEPKAIAQKHKPISYYLKRAIGIEEMYGRWVIVCRGSDWLNCPTGDVSVAE